MTKKVWLLFTLLVATASAGVAANAAQMPGLTYNVTLGWNSYNLIINNNSGAAISAIKFDYGNPNTDTPFILPYSGTCEGLSIAPSAYTNTYTLSACLVANGTSVTFPQEPVAAAAGAGMGKNMPMSQYYGLAQNIQAKVGDVWVPVTYELACAPGAACNNDPDKGKEVGVYYADWSVYERGYAVDKIPFNVINTVYYAFGGLNAAKQELELFDPNADFANKTALQTLALQRLKTPYLNVAYSYGGWGSIANGNVMSGDLSVLFSYYPEKIADVAQQMVGAAVRTGMNGVDIDYEWAGPFEGDAARLGGHAPLAVDIGAGRYVAEPLSPSQADGFAELMYDLRMDMSAHFASKPYQVSTALFAGIDKLRDLNRPYGGKIEALKGKTNLQIIIESATHVGLMTYDYHGAFDANSPAPYNVSDFQSAMGAAANAPYIPGSDITQLHMQGTLAAIKNLVPSADMSKMVVGVAAYSRIVKLADNGCKSDNAENQHGLFCALAPAAEQQLGNAYGELSGDAIYQSATGGVSGSIVGSGTISYKCINDHSTCHSSAIVSVLNSMKIYEEPIPGIANGADSPRAFGNHLFMSYDNDISARKKAQYVLEHNLGGTMIWEIDDDLPADNCANPGNHSQVCAIYNKFSQ